jgi:tetratricopeptide (TPR) repeat protein
MAEALQQAAALHAAGVAPTADMRPQVGADLLRDALAVLGTPAGDDPAARQLRGRIVLSLALAESEQGRIDTGLRLLSDAERLLPAEQHGLLHGQRAMLLRRTGRDDLALAEYGRALAALDERTAPEEVARVLLNRGVLHMAAARPGPARADLLRCRALALGHGLAGLAVKAGHNLGYLDYLAGDIVGALRRYAEAAHRYADLLPGMLAVLSLDRARALLAVGLHTDATRELASALSRLDTQRLSQDHAEAHLAQAEAALLAGDPAAARRWAARAHALFRRRDNPRWTARARLVGLRAEHAAGVGAKRIARRAAAQRRQLRELSLPEDARVAGLLQARALTAAGRPAEAGRLIQGCRPGRSDRLDTRLLWRLAQAETATAAGSPRQGTRHLAAGLSTLHRYRSHFGALDLQTGVAAYGRELAGLGLRAALAAGRVGDVFRWAERARAQALLLTPVRPPDNPETAAALEELRGIRLAIGARAMTGRSSPALRQRADALEHLLRERAWITDGAGPGARPANLRQIRQHLGDAAMATFMPDGPMLRALVVTAHRAQVVPIGPLADVTEALTRLRADLDAQAGRAMPARLAAALSEATRRDASTLATALLQPLLPLLGDRTLIVVPTGTLVTVPWATLPGLAGRPVTVAPSATAWSAAKGRPNPADAAPRVLLAAGPDNDRGEQEIRAIASRYPAAAVLTGHAATPTATLAALGVADIAHLAAHGQHATDNPLFSRLDLHGGPLLGYDLLRLPASPSMVVLSSCDVGLHDVRPGDEAMGMATALLGSGTRTVVASVCRVADDVAMTVMTRYHQLLSQGRSASAALAEAVPRGLPSGFVCFGAG